MWLLKGTAPFSSLNAHCSQWAWTYLKYHLCGTKDAVALTLGLVSVLSWGVAEVPQIVTNYKEKSTEGLSIAFLMTWIVGDVFNLVGCWLEPATLPTQFYMALLYTVTTLVLTGQTVYYGHMYQRLKANKSSPFHESGKRHGDDTLTKAKFLYPIDEKEDKTEANGSNISSLPIPVSAPTIGHQGSPGRDLYYRSARSLSKSPVPRAGTWLSHSRDSGRTPPIHSYGRHSSREPLLGSLGPTQSAPTMVAKNMLCLVSSTTLLFCTFHLHLSMNRSLKRPPHGMVIRVGRKLLQSKVAGAAVGHGGGGSKIGSILGWAMAAIYMGGRLPQICLNIRRGNVEGLSLLMFMFALIGNATYVGSILVNSLDWFKIRPNMPWLVDAGGCVLLDSFILIQFFYFRSRKTEDVENGNDK